MIPLRLELAGITRFADPVVVDFAAMPAGLVAVAGENGAGKTSLLESILLAIYGTLPTRPGSVYEYLCSEHAHVELLVEYDGRVWRFRREFRRKQRKASATVWIDDEPQNSDGKVGEVDDVVALRWPPLSQVLASAFAAQGGAGSFLSLKPAARKELVVRMLGLDRLQVLAKAAQVELADARTVRDRAAGRLAVAEASAGKLGEARAAHVEAVATLNAADALHSAQKRVLGERSAVLSKASDAVDAARAAADGVQRELGAAKRAASDAKDAWGLAAVALLSATKAAERCDSVRALADGLPGLDERQRHHDALSALRDELRSLPGGDPETIRAQIESKRAALAEADTAQRAIDEIDAKLPGLRKSAEDERTTRRALDRDELATGLLNRVPCEGAVWHDNGHRIDCSACPFLLEAEDAKSRLSDLRDTLEWIEGAGADVDKALAERARLAEHRDTVAIRADGLARDEMALIEAERAEAARPALRERIEARRAKAGAPVDLSELAAARAAAADLPDLLAAAGARDARKEAEQKAGIAHALAAEAASKAQERLTAATDRLAPLEAVEREARKPAMHARDCVAQAERALDKAKSQEARAAGRVEALEHAEQALRQARDAMRTADEAHEDAAMLAQALGRDGVQAMELDAVGPAVSATATEILQVVYGPRFAVQLVTQVKKAGAAGRRGETKEVFDVRVLDTERGTDGPAERLSGGEQVVVSEALKLALAIFAAQSGAARLKTLIRDESDGALDAERALNYPAMLRRAQVLGGFERVLLVSHRPDNVTACDAVLDVRDGQARLSLT